MKTENWESEEPGQAVIEVPADKPVVEGGTGSGAKSKPGRTRSTTKAPKNGKGEKVLLLLTSNGENHGIYREITADELDELSIQMLRNPEIRIASAVIAKVSAPAISFAE